MEPEGRGDKTTPPLCAKGCGFFGNPATRNLCSKCYNALLLEQLKPGAITDDDGPQTKTPPLLPPPACGAAAGGDAVVHGGLEQQQGAVAPRPKRCDGCRKKVGLLGFECRCGGTFCGAHRHPEQHRCTFDFRTVGREAIVRANPLVKADKLQRI